MDNENKSAIQTQNDYLLELIDIMGMNYNETRKVKHALHDIKVLLDEIKNLDK